MLADFDKKFQDKLTSMKSHAAKTAEGLAGTGQTVWDSWDDQGPDNAGPDRFTNDFSKEFDRTNLRDKYIQAYTLKTGAQLSDVLAIRTQNDWLMQAERDFLLRRCSRIRSEAHAASIKRGLGLPKGSIWAGMFRYVKVLLAMAGVTGKTYNPDITTTRKPK